jgi:hypothetical protein
MNINKKDYNDKLVKEYTPPFSFNFKLTHKERAKIKLPNPYVNGQFETFLFPVCSSKTKFADCALFH